MRVRRPAVAGQFYPAHPTQLVAAVHRMLAEAEAARIGDAAPARGAIAPHAGYVYSGRTAACVFARLDVPRRVVVVGPNHTGDGRSLQGGSACALGVWQTPAGDVPVDEALAARLLAECPIVEDDPEAHRREHSIEVMLPFLLARRPDVVVTPIVLGWADWPHTRTLGEALATLVRTSEEPVLLLASSDMNHFEPAAVGKQKDDLALAEVQKLDGERLLEVTRRHRISMCGRAPAAAVLHAAKLLGGERAEVVDYSHSGMVTGDEGAVVGYAGVIAR
jgi:hypothetical protein